jgi:hypothetical protein
MRSGWLGGIAAGLIVIVLATGVEGAVAVNGQPVSFDPAPRKDGDSLLVPVVSFAPLLGIEVVERDGRVTLRWSGGRDDLAPERIRWISDVAFTPLDELVGRVGGTFHQTGDETSIDVPEARLIELLASDEDVVVRFDRFAPTLVTESRGVSVVRFLGCRADGVVASVVFGPGDVGRATLVATSESACELRVSFLEEAALAVRRLEADGVYSVSLTPAVAPSDVSTTLLGDGLSFSDGEVPVGESVVALAYVHADNWRDRLDVQPLLPPTGAGTRSSINEAMASSGAAIALSSRSGADPGLVVIDNVPFSIEAEPTLALGFDVFGSLVSFIPLGRTFAVSPTARIPLDGVDRPVGYDEIVGYPPGYTGSIARGFPDGFYIVRIRDGLVVSILDESFVVADPSATLLVASGAARARLANLALGDRVELVWEIDPERRFVRDALSIERVLVWDGQPQLPVPGDERAEAMSWSVVGTDWQGGFFFLTASSDRDLADREILSLLATMPATPRTAVVLETDGAGALALDVGTFHVRWGSRTAVSVSLSATLKP